MGSRDGDDIMRLCRRLKPAAHPGATMNGYFLHRPFVPQAIYLLVLSSIPVNEFDSPLFDRHLRVTRLCSLIDLFQVSGFGCQEKTCCHSIGST